MATQQQEKRISELLLSKDRKDLYFFSYKGVTYRGEYYTAVCSFVHEYPAAADFVQYLNTFYPVVQMVPAVPGS